MPPTKVPDDACTGAGAYTPWGKETNVLGSLDGNVSEEQKNAAVKQFMDG